MVTVSKIFQGSDTSIFDVAVTANSDIAATIPHGLGTATDVILITPKGIPRLAAVAFSDKRTVVLAFSASKGTTFRVVCSAPRWPAP